MIDKKIFKSKIMAYLLIYSFFLLITSEAAPNNVNFDTGKEFKPVVRVKEGGEQIPAAQKNRFERLIEEGKKLFQEEMDYEGAKGKFKEAQALAITRAQKADALFYLSLVYYATQEEKGSEEFEQAIRKLIEIDYYREPDLGLCPPRYMVLIQEVKKEYGALKILSKPPGADVYLNDSKVPAGKTPLTIGSKAGSVKIRVKKGNKEKKAILRVIAGKETASSIFVLKGGSGLLLIIGGLVLAGGGAALLGGAKGNGGGNGPTTGSIQVNSTPTGAQVYLDGTNTGETTNTTLTNVSPGVHTVSLIMEGYEDDQRGVSVTAGQTATVSITLTPPTITVIELPPDTVWTTGEEVEIKWETSGSGSSRGVASTSAGFNSSINQGRRALSRFQRRAFQEKRFLRSVKRKSRGLENVESSENFGILSSNTSKPQGVSGESSSSAKEGDIVRQRTKDIRSIKRKSIVGRMRRPVAPQISNDKFLPSGNAKVLGLSYVKIDLYKGNTFNQNIAESTENDGSYLWTVDSSLEDGADYKVRFSSTSDSGVYGESDAFTIEGRSITVTSPTSGDIWITGQSVNITWTSTGAISNYVDLDIYKGTTLAAYASSIDNDGIFPWVVDSFFVEGTDYKIRISDDTDASIYGESDIFTINHGYEYVSQWGTYGTGNSQFDLPVRIATDSSGSVYVVDLYNNRIQKFTSSGGYLTQWGSYGSGDGQFDYPYGIAVDSSGDVYVADYWNYRIQKFTSSGGYLTQWGSYGSEDGQFDDTLDVAVDSSGYVYVVEGNNNRIQKFTSNGTFVTKWGSYGTGDGQFDNPYGIAVDSSGYVYVADMGNDRIQKFTSSGGYLTQWGSYGSEDGQFDEPLGVAVDSSGYVYVADTYNDRIQKFTSDGTFVTKWGSYGSGNGEVNWPEGIAVDSSGYVYVADTYNHRVQKFQPIDTSSSLSLNSPRIIKSNLGTIKSSKTRPNKSRTPLTRRPRNKK